MLSIKQCLQDIVNRFNNIFNWITEETVQDNWRIIKYHNGECRCVYTNSSLTFAKASSWGYSYYSDKITLSYPVTFDEIYECDGQTLGGVTYQVKIDNITSTNLLYRFVSYAHDWSTQSGVTIFIKVYGKLGGNS